MVHWDAQVARVAPFVAAATAWVSLNPYFFWGSSRPLLVVSLVAGAVTVILFMRGIRPSLPSTELAGVLLLSVFLIYLTTLSRVGGGHVKWVFVLPTLWLLVLLDGERRRHALMVFSTIFVISVIPSLIVSVLAIAGVPLDFSTIPAANSLMAEQGVRMLTLPGVLFFESNSALLPWGGVLFRLCGMYDEPGMVGTIAALLLAAHRYSLRQWRVAVLYLAGLLSFSLAFAVLTTFGLLAGALLRRRLLAVIPVLPVLAATALVTGAWHISTPPDTESSITIETEAPATLAEVGAPGTSPDDTRSSLTTATPSTVGPSGVDGPNSAAETSTPVRPSGRLRQTDRLDNRSLPPMEALVSDYFAGGPRIWLVGVASDASVVRGGMSQTWKRLLTDYGAIGFSLLLTAMGLIAWSRLVESRSGWVALFLAVYALSSYQRPVVWMPYALLILLCGSVVSASAERVPRPSAAEKDASRPYSRVSVARRT